jgi:hypothetical protein
MNIPAKSALVGAAAALALGGCAWFDRTFGTDFSRTESEGADAVVEGPSTAGASPAAAAAVDANSYDEEEIVRAASAFFGETAETAGEAVARAFKERGRPVGYIEGEELAGAVGVGLRYGQGTLVLKNGQTRQVFWQGPSVGFDTGANASKVFTLVYDLRSADQIYQRFPGVSGSAYFVGGVGVNYYENEDIVVAPLRAGVGLGAGVNVGYLHFTREQEVVPL